MIYEKFNQIYNYRRLVWIETRKHIDVLLKEWNGLDYYTSEKLLTNKEFRKNDPNVHVSGNKLQPTIDHKNSISFGFKNKIDAKEIGGIDNLCICSRSTNSRKSNVKKQKI